MTYSSDGGPPGDPAVSNVLGFVLVFSFLIIGFTIYQGLVVPQQNRQVEFDHNQVVQRQMQDLRNAVQNAAGGSDRSASVTLSADYPRRTLSENLAASSGSLHTADLGGGITVTNARPIDEETRDYFNETSPTIGPLTTKSIRYRPSYTRYTEAPRTVFENSVAYNRFDSAPNITLTDQAVIDGRRITLVAVTGNLSRGGEDTVSVDVEALSTAGEPIAVKNTSGSKIRITIPTQLTAENWTTLLADEMDTPGSDDKYVEDVKQVGPNRVSIILEADVTYDLRLAKVGVGSGTVSERPHYVTDVAGDGTSVPEGGTKKLVVEVRDRFNNPVSNVTLESEITESAGSVDIISPSTAVTNSKGRASFVYTAPGDVDDPQDATVTVFFDAKRPGRQNVTLDIEVLDADGSGGGTCTDEPGTGGEEQWCARDPKTTVSQPGGKISEIGNASHINVSDPSFTPVNPTDGSVNKDEERFRLAFVIERDLSVLTGTTRYLFVVPTQTSGFRQTLDDANGKVENREVTIYEDSSVNADGSGYTTLVDTDLKQGDLNKWYKGLKTLDLLDDDHYTGNVQSELDQVKNFMQNNTVRVYIVDMDGRAELEIR